MHRDSRAMGDLVSAYFKCIFTADPNLDCTPVLNLFNPVISAENNAKLCSDFSDQEISDALFQIGPLKAPGPDGFPARFFQRNWDSLKENIIKAVREFFRTSIMPEGVNETSIVLIPKVANPCKVSDF